MRIRTEFIGKFWFNLLPPELQERRGPERLGIPHTFKPQLPFVEAVLTTAGLFLRIVSGCILFALWGAYSLFVWGTVRSLWLRAGLLLALLLAFLAAVGVIMALLGALMQWLASKSLRQNKLDISSHNRSKEP